LPPDLDENGKMINPHNPEFITKVPWYLGESGPTLKHHTIQKVDHFLSMSEADALIQNKYLEKKSATKAVVYRKGACKNCGAMTHKEKDCVERPRSSKKAAWKSGLDLAQDEVVLKVEEFGKISYDAKRDHWQGYNPEEYKKTIDKYNRMDNERRKLRQEQKELRRREHESKLEKKLLEKEKLKLAKLEAAPNTLSSTSTQGGAAHDEDDEQQNKSTDSDDSDSDSDSDYDSDEEEDEDDDTKDFIERDEEARDFQGRLARQGGVGGAEMKTTVRNLRIREDTPKYLRNLDLNSAFYDPKTRSMRANPFPDENPEDLVFAGDNFVRHSGDALKLASTQVLCWEMQARGEDIDVFSNPSQAELLQKQFQEKKTVLQNTKKTEILEKYGLTDQPQESLDIRLRLGQTEGYTEYSRDGRIVKGVGKVAYKTKYEEDVFTNNHTSVWGSFYHRGRCCWGFACCHSLVRNSYCVGEKGRAINDSVSNQSITPQQERKMLEKVPIADRAKSATLVKRSDVFGESSGAIPLDEDKVKKALQQVQDRGERESQDAKDERKRGYNSMEAVDVCPEDMEAYRLTKQKREDPMAALLHSEELLPYVK